MGRFGKAQAERLVGSLKKTYSFQTRAELFGTLWGEVFLLFFVGGEGSLLTRFTTVSYRGFVELEKDAPSSRGCSPH